MEPPLDDAAFRNAISYAFNYEEMVLLDAVGYGTVPHAGFITPSMEFYAETRSMKYDPSTAASLLDAAGYVLNDGGKRVTPEGDAISLTLLTRSDYSRVAELTEEYLEAVGIDVDVDIVDRATWIAMKDAYEYDLTITRTTPWGMLMHANWGSGYFDSRRTGAGVLHNLADEEYLALCDAILATADSSLLEDYAIELQEYFASEMPAIPLYWNMVIIPYRDGWTGWQPDPLYGIFNVATFTSLEYE
jgi:peptide/nickel transport system substrate-binding protein